MKTLKYSMLFGLAVVTGLMVASPGRGDDDQREGPPLIVASVALKNQSGPIPQTALYVPKDNGGLFRISLYWETTTKAAAGLICGSLNWTDDTQTPGSQGINCLPLAASTAQATGRNYFAQSQSVVVRDKGGAPITYMTAFDPNNPISGFAQYSIFITVEKLQEK